MRNLVITYSLTAVVLAAVVSTTAFLLLRSIKKQECRGPKLRLSLLCLLTASVIAASCFFHGIFLGDLALETALLIIMISSVMSFHEYVRIAMIAGLSGLLAVAAFYPPLHLFLYGTVALMALACCQLSLFFIVSRPSLLVTKVSTPVIVQDAFVSAGWMLVLFFSMSSLFAYDKESGTIVMFVLTFLLLAPALIVTNLVCVMPDLSKQIVAFCTNVPQEKKETKTIKAAHKESRRLLYEAIEHWLNDEQQFLNPGLTVEDVASHFLTNRNYVTSAFGEFAKMSFSEYLTRLRVNHARVLGEENPWLTVSELATNSGYNIATTFSMAFIRICGISPRDWLVDLRAQRKK